MESNRDRRNECVGKRRGHPDVPTATYKGKVLHILYEKSPLEPWLLSLPQETGMVVQHSKCYCLRRNRSLRFPAIDLDKPSVKLSQQNHILSTR